MACLDEIKIGNIPMKSQSMPNILSTERISLRRMSLDDAGFMLGLLKRVVDRFRVRKNRSKASRKTDKF
jgi:hypothetical protein